MKLGLLAPLLAPLLALAACGRPVPHKDTLGETAELEDSGERPVDPTPGSWPAIQPLCSIYMTCDLAIVDEPKTSCTLSITDGEGMLQYLGQAGVEKRGRTSLNYPKPSYGVELREPGLWLLPTGASWRYLDTGVYPGEGWTGLDFDDSSWGVGEAPLGYASGERTTLSYGSDPKAKPVTVWFRASFRVEDPSEVEELALRLRRDDGAVVYLNGGEVARDNLPEGEIAPETLALETMDSIEEEDGFKAFSVDASLLRAGVNVMAVEVHQRSASSSDLVLDLALEQVGDDVSSSLLGMGGESDWVLLASWMDPSFARNKFVMDLYGSFGIRERYAPEMAFCTLSLNGRDQGLYLLGEKIKQDDDRVDIARDETGHGRSFIVKTDDRELPILENTAGYGDWVLVWPKLAGASASEVEGVVDWLSGWQAGILSYEPWDEESGVFVFLDESSAVDFLLVEELTQNTDAYTFSVHLWKDLDTKMYFTPWDFDLAYGLPSESCGTEGWVRKQNFVYAMTYIPGFNEHLSARWRLLREGILADDSVSGRIRAYREVLGPALERNFEVWPWDDPSYERYDGDMKPCWGEDPDAEYTRLEAWLLGRMAWMDANIDNFDGKSW